MITYTTRNDWVSSLPSGLTILEVGVFKGEFSEALLNTKPKELILVDVFESVVGSGDKDGLNFTTVDMAIVKNSLEVKFTNCPVRLIQGLSQNILPKFPPNYFDIVYLDADHFNPGFRIDLLNSLIITKSNGLIAGHDFNFNHYPDIVTEVNRLIESKLVTLEHLTNDLLPSFGLRKSCLNQVIK
jgi:hypothetical protein